MSVGPLTTYTQACRITLESDLRDSTSWTGELESCLMRLRQALACCVCSRLVDSPMGPANNVCHHFVCRGCRGGKPRFIQRGCSWCKEHSKFVSNPQISTIIVCFRRLCQYLVSYLGSRPLSSAGPHSLEWIIREVASEVPEQELKAVPAPQTGSPDLSKNASDQARNIDNNAPSVNGDKKTKISRKIGKHLVQSKKVIKPVVLTKAKFVRGRSKGLKNRNKVGGWSRGYVKNSSDDVCMGDSKLDRNGSFEEFLDDKTDPKLYCLDNVILSEHDYNRNTLDIVNSSFISVRTGSKQSVRAGILNHQHKKASTISSPHRSEVSPKSAGRKPKAATIRQIVETKHDRPIEENGKQIRSVNGQVVRRNYKVKSVRSGCRCAMMAANPGKLTCCGQRCTCYAAFKGCVVDCKCRGCRNPRGDTTLVTGMGVPAVSMASYGYNGRQFASTLSMANSIGRVTLS